MPLVCLSTTEHRADYTYDSAGRLATAADATSGTFTYGYQYNQTTATAPREGSTAGAKQDFMPFTLTRDGSTTLQTLRTYEARRDALALVQNKAGTTVRSSYAYTVNALGQRTGLTTAFDLGPGVTSNPGDTGWAYDPLGQVQSAAAPGTAADRYFEYDSIGNRLQSRTGTATDSGGTLTEYFGTLGTPPTPGANALNQYAGIATGGTTVEPVHDDDGNATSCPLPKHPSANSTLAWDAENRLASANVNSITTTYLYDALSRRIAKVPASGPATLYLYDGWNRIAEYTGTTPAVSKTFLWGLDLSGSLQGAGGVGGLLSVRQGGSSFCPTYDGNGNVSEYLASNGDVAAHFEYDPFGNTVVDTDSTDQFSYRFSTKPLDFETGLYYYGYRYYEPVAGRWPSRDPIGERGGLSLYGFLGNDGVNSADMLGKALFIVRAHKPNDPRARQYSLEDGLENIRKFLELFDELDEGWFNDAMNDGRVYFNNKKYIGEGKSKADFRKKVEREKTSTHDNIQSPEAVFAKVAQNAKLATEPYDQNIFAAHGGFEWTNQAKREWKATNMIHFGVDRLSLEEVKKKLNDISNKIVWVSCLKGNRLSETGSVIPAKGEVAYLHENNNPKNRKIGCRGVSFLPFEFNVVTTDFDPDEP